MKYLVLNNAKVNTAGSVIINDDSLTRKSIFDNNSKSDIYYQLKHKRLASKVVAHVDRIICKRESLHGLIPSFELPKWQKKSDGVYERSHEEYQYLLLVQDILNFADRRPTRNAFTLSMFSPHKMVFNCRGGRVPCLTTKKLYLKGVIEELMFFIRGDTQTKKLEEKGIKIWKLNTSPEFQKSIGLEHLEEGDLGKMYGYQWRNWGEDGIDQLAQCIKLLMDDKNSRRNICSAWNVSDLNAGVLNPCHILFQFYVNDLGEVCLQMYQRSADVALGMPFNIASYALLLHIVVKITGLPAGDFHYVIGDAHIYFDHAENMKKQLGRTPMKFPTVTLQIPPLLNSDSISALLDGADSKWVIINDYQSHPSIKFKLF